MDLETSRTFLRLSVSHSVVQTSFTVRLCQSHVLTAFTNSACTKHARINRVYSPSEPAIDRDVLHWLPILQRIEYKLYGLVYKAVHRPVPVYLTDLCIAVSIH